MAEPEKEVIVTREGGGGAAGMLIAAVLVIALLAFLFFMFKDRIMGGTDVKADIKIEGPATGK